MFEGFETARLRVAIDTPLLKHDLSALFAPNVVADLPPDFVAARSFEQQEQVLRELKQEAHVLVISDHESVVGLLLLFEEAEQQAVRLGYYFKETAWGRGYASECLAGLLNVCEDLGLAVIAGVVTANGASIRVLEKRGFRRIAQNGNVVEYIWTPWKG